MDFSVQCILKSFLVLPRKLHPAVALKLQFQRTSYSSLPRLSFWETHDKPSLFSNRHLGLFVAGNNIALVHFVHEEWQQRRNCLFGCKIKWFDCKTNGCLYAPTQMKILTNENCWQRQAKLIKKQHWSECGISFTHKLPKLFIMQYFLELFYSAVGLYMDSIYKKK